MKFEYEYRTSDNVRHSGVIAAKNRDAVYTKLARQRIKPGFVKELPDPWRPVRVIAYAVGVLGVIAAVAAYLQVRSTTATPMSRRQLYGDPVQIERGVASDWGEVLSNPTDRYLARYAQPGWRVRVRDDAKVRAAIATDLARNAATPVRFAGSDLMTSRDLKRIVAGMRKEAADFMAAGGDAEKYLLLLDERQDRECEIRQTTVRDFADACETMPSNRVYDAWMSCNRKLSSMGLRTVPMPEKLADQIF